MQWHSQMLYMFSEAPVKFIKFVKANFISYLNSPLIPRKENPFYRK